MKKTVMFFWLLLFMQTASVLFATDIPYLTGRVTDNAELLSPTTHRLLTEQLKAHEDRTSNQIAVLTVHSIGDESIEEYAVNVFDAWQLGQADKDNGVLIVIAPNDRRMRIEVGYGLEATLTDAMASRIIQNRMTPKFKNGDYDGGISDGAKAVIALLEGGDLPEMATQNSSSENSHGFNFPEPDLPLIPRILMGAFIFGIIGLFTIIGITTPGVGWFLYVFLIPFWATFPIVILGVRGAFVALITYVIGFPIAKLFLKNTQWYQKAAKNLRVKGKTSVGGFNFSSGSSGGSWSSGSSFSGGGGSSGGGGASGSW